MTKAMIKILDGIKDGSAMSAAVTSGGYCVARIDHGVFHQHKPPVGFGWSVSAGRKSTATIYFTPRDVAVLFTQKRGRPHVRINLPARRWKAVANG